MLKISHEKNLGLASTKIDILEMLTPSRLNLRPNPRKIQRQICVGVNINVHYSNRHFKPEQFNKDFETKSQNHSHVSNCQNVSNSFKIEPNLFWTVRRDRADLTECIMKLIRLQ